MASRDLPIPLGRDPLVDGALRVLAARGPLDLDELAETLGLVDPDGETEEDALEEVLAELDELGRIVDLPGERVADLPGLLDGVTLTHRLTRDELDAGRVHAAPDLMHLVALADRSVPLHGGGRLQVEFGGGPGDVTQWLRGTEGWLDGAGEGALLAATLRDGRVRVELGVEEPSTTRELVRAFADAAAEVDADADEHGEGLPVEIAPVLALALAGLGEVDALPPLGELAAAAGVRAVGELLAVSDAATARERTEDADGRDLIALYAFDLAPEELGALRRLRVLAAPLARGGQLHSDEFDEAVLLLRLEPVAEAYLDEAGDDESAAVLFERLLLDGAVGLPAAAARLDEARRAERDGAAEAATRARQFALGEAPGWPVALCAAAVDAEDRGDAATALELYGRAEVEVSSCLRQVLTGGRVPGSARNAPCPCGSGRKAKKCCGDRQVAPLAARAPWLVERILEFLHGRGQQERWRRLREARYPPPREPRPSDPLLRQLVTFDAGGLQAYLDLRGHLLPADERELVQQWRDARPALYRLVAVAPRRLLLEPVDTDVATCDARYEGDGQWLEEDGHVLATLVGDGGGGSLVFDEPERLGPSLPAPLLAALRSGLRGADLAAALPAGLSLTNREGEPSVLCTARLSGVTRTPEAVAALVDAGLEDEDGVLRLLHELSDDESIVRGRVEWEDGALTAHANGEARFERLVALVRQALPAARVESEERVDPLLARDDAERFAVPEPPHEPSADERAAMAVFLRGYEERWVDQPVPALGGRTPREAAGDPRLRQRLEALLDQPSTMDDDRLRDLLGLS